MSKLSIFIRDYIVKEQYVLINSILNLLVVFLTGYNHYRYYQ